MTITRLTRRTVYENHWMTVHEDEVRFPGGTTGIYGVVEKPDFVAIAPLDDQGRLHLVSQFRYPIGRRIWEVPMGVAQGSPEEQARTELREETGLIAQSMAHIGHLLQAPGYSGQGYDVFLATGLTQGAAMPEPSEGDIFARAFPWPEVERMMATGEICDATTIAVLGLLVAKGHLPPA